MDWTKLRIDEILKMLESSGLDAITTRTVATASGSSQAALHELFGGKVGLIDAAALKGFGILRDALQQSQPSSDPTNRILALCRAHREFGARHSQLISLMYSRPFGDFAPGEADIAIAAEILRTFTAEVALLVGAERRSPQVTDTAIGLIALLVGLHHQERSGTLGSTPATIQRRWTAAISRYTNPAETS